MLKNRARLFSALLVAACVFAPVRICFASDHMQTHSVLVFSPGESLFAAFGHVAIVSQSPQNPHRKVYSLGSYDYLNADAIRNYALGRLDFRIHLTTWKGALTYYRDFNRGAELIPLNLTPGESRQLTLLLDRMTLPQHRVYRYNHFTSNCATKVRDILDTVLSGALKESSRLRMSEQSVRADVRRHLQQMPLWQLAIDFSLGPSVDRRINRFEAQYLPAVLGEELKRVILPDGRKLTGVPSQIPAAKNPHGRTPGSIANRVLGALALLVVVVAVLLLVWGPSTAARRMIGALLCILGIVDGAAGALLFFLAWSGHVDTHHNVNHLIFPVTHLLLLVPGIALLRRGKIGGRLGRFSQIYLIAALGLLVPATLLALSGIWQDNLRFVLSGGLPMIAIAAAAWRTGAISKLAREPSQ